MAGSLPGCTFVQAVARIWAPAPSPHYRPIYGMIVKRFKSIATQSEGDDLEESVDRAIRR